MKSSLVRSRYLNLSAPGNVGFIAGPSRAAGHNRSSRGGCLRPRQMQTLQRHQAIPALPTAEWALGLVSSHVSRLQTTLLFGGHYRHRALFGIPQAMAVATAAFSM